MKLKTIELKAVIVNISLLFIPYGLYHDITEIYTVPKHPISRGVWTGLNCIGCTVVWLSWMKQLLFVCYSKGVSCVKKCHTFLRNDLLHAICYLLICIHSYVHYLTRIEATNYITGCNTVKEWPKEASSLWDALLQEGS